MRKGAQHRRGCLRPGFRGGIEFQVRASDRIVASFRQEIHGPVFECAEEMRREYLSGGWIERIEQMH